MTSKLGGTCPCRCCNVSMLDCTFDRMLCLLLQNLLPEHPMNPAPSLCLLLLYSFDVCVVHEARAHGSQLV